MSGGHEYVRKSIEDFLSNSALVCNDQAKVLLRDGGIFDGSNYIDMKAKSQAFIQAMKYVRSMYVRLDSGEFEGRE